MKLESLKVLEVKRLNNDEDDSKQAGITAESLPFVFEVLSKQLYSNPIGSVVREITSNCFDSHKEANVDDPVIVRKTYTADEGYSIEFEDFGVGISPDRMNTIYINYFSSTKRDTNDLIGGFGIGSKTPLAYADFFYITTRFDGIEYSYLFHRGESKPTLELLSNSETTERNGTCIKINIENNDVNKFTIELKEQLAYFDNVYFENWNINNEYDIYEGTYFKFRSDVPQDRSYRGSYGDVISPIHISIGKVKYPIDFNKITVAKEIKNIPIAVKFEIGELEITPSRESIRYNDKNKGVIEERIQLAIDEVIKLIEDQNPEIETLKEYNDAVNKEVKLVFNKDKGHALSLWEGSKISKNFKFAPLKDVKIKRMPKELFFMWENYGYISSNREFRKMENSVSNNDILNKGYIIINRDDRMSKYTDLKILQELGQTYLLRKKEIKNFDEANKELQFRSGTEQGKARIIYEYNKVINKIVVDNSNGTYEDQRASDEWIADYKRGIIESTAAWQRKKNNKIFFRDMNTNNSREITEYDIVKRKGIIVYGFREDKYLLSNIANVVFTCKSNFRKLGFPKTDKAMLVMQIAQSAEKVVLQADKSIHCKYFLDTLFFRKIYSVHQLDIITNDYRRDNGFKEVLIPDFKKDCKEIDTLRQKYNYGSNYSGFGSYTIKPIKEIIDIGERFNAKYSNIKFPFQSYINSSVLNSDEAEEYIRIVKSKGIRLKNEYYLKSKRQLEYEQGIRDILNTIKNPVKHNLLTFTLNNNQNDNQESNNQTEGEIQDNNEIIE